VLCPQVGIQALDHPGAPALFLLPRDDVRPIAQYVSIIALLTAGRAEPPGRDGLLNGVEYLVVLGRGSN
jgi:hypothetical protein